MNQAGGQAPPVEPPLVLVADNDPGVSGLLGEVLERAGLRTTLVADGAAALRRLEEGGLALFVCDLDMPEMNGQEVLRRLDGMVDPPPALVVSGYLDARLEGELSGRAAVVGLFRKPFDVFEFAEEARRVVDERTRGSRQAAAGRRASDPTGDAADGAAP